MGRKLVLIMTFSIILGVIAAFCAIAVVYPYLLYPLVLRFLPSLHIDRCEGMVKRNSCILCFQRRERNQGETREHRDAQGEAPGYRGAGV